MNFGMSKEKVDAHGIRLFGNIDGKSQFSLSEIETIKKIAVKVGHMVYGRNLAMVVMAALTPAAQS
jgi:hypothetical protein